MSTRSWITRAALGSIIFAAGVAPGLAQPDDHDHRHRQRGVATHRRGFRLFDPRGQQVRNLIEFRYIVPSTEKYGAYYTYNNGYYFTPASDPSEQPQAPAPLEFGAFQHYEELAARFERSANALCLDLHRNYRHNDDFRTVYREAYTILDGAKFLHDSTHREDRKALKASISGIDRLFHHVEEDLETWTPQRQFAGGRLSLPARMEEMEALIHHLMYDLGVQTAHDDLDDDEDAPRPE